MRQRRSPNRSVISAIGIHEWSGTICEQFITNQNGNSWVKEYVWVGSPGWGPGRMVAYLVCCRPAIAVLRACRQEAANQAETQRPNFGSILDPDGCWRFCLHHSTLRNRIQIWISKSDPELDPSISVLGRKIGRQIGHPMGHCGPVLSWVHNRAPSRPGCHLFKNYYYSVLTTTWFSGALVCLSMVPPSHIGMCSWYCALAVHCKLRLVVMLCSQSIRIRLVSAVSLFRISETDNAVRGVSRKPPGKGGQIVGSPTI